MLHDPMHPGWLDLPCREHMYSGWELKLLLQQVVQQGRMTSPEEEEWLLALGEEEDL